MMRFATHAGRLTKGVPIFVTWSPDEKHNVLMLRLSRTRRNDPLNRLDKVAAKFGGLYEPSITNDAETLRLEKEDLLDYLPAYDDRRAILARDSLASVEGFRLSVLLTCEYLFGMRVCIDCPKCNHVQDFKGLGCSDLFGSNALPEGGIFGRADGIFISIEAQKSAGGLHAHGQLHIQCIHQHTPLVSIFEKLVRDGNALAKGYLSYKAHVSRQEYADVESWKSRQDQTEEAWPEYKGSTKLVSSFKSLMAIDDPSDWCDKYLNDYVQPVQEMKQHHVHTLNGKGERVPLTHCRRADDPSKCKGDFPRTKWIISEAVVLCPGLVNKMGMASSGRRNRVGALQGPQNDEYLNGTHPAMSVALPYNSDVQLPYRLPVCAHTHATQFCGDNCLAIVDHNASIEATQYSQDAQIGYACDYQNKRAARCCNETKEFVKGHKDLGSALDNKPIGVISKRHVIRLCSDAYGKGVVRSLQESTNLRVYHKESDVLFAESIRTSGTVCFPGIDVTLWREAVIANVENVSMLAKIHVDRSNPRRGTAAIKNLVFLYGHRPKTSPCWFLSLYEFVRYWDVMPVRYPTCLQANEQDDKSMHAILTESGKRRLADAKATHEKPDFQAGTDYIIKEAPPADADWYPFEETTFTSAYRHTWVLVRRRRPNDPTFLRCPMPRRGECEAERNAAIIMTYFHPFTLNPDWNTEDVPFLGQLCAIGNSWHGSMLRWFNGRVLSAESSRYIQNFLVVTRVRPEEENLENSDDLLSDEEFVVDNTTFLDAISTRVNQKKHFEKMPLHAADIDLDETCSPADKDAINDNSADAFKKADKYWSIPKMSEKMQKRAGVHMSDTDFLTIKKMLQLLRSKQISSKKRLWILSKAVFGSVKVTAQMMFLTS